MHHGVFSRVHPSRQFSPITSLQNKLSWTLPFPNDFHRLRCQAFKNMTIVKFNVLIGRHLKWRAINDLCRLTKHCFVQLHSSLLWQGYQLLGTMESCYQYVLLLYCLWINFILLPLGRFFGKRGSPPWRPGLKRASWLARSVSIFSAGIAVSIIM